MLDNHKYELTDESMLHEGDRVYRIRALTDIKNDLITVKKGDLGGFVESKENLGYKEGDRSWIDRDSIVKGLSDVSGHSNILEGSVVDGYSSITGGSNIKGGSIVFDSQVESASTLNGVGTSSSTFVKSQAEDSNFRNSFSQ